MTRLSKILAVVFCLIYFRFLLHAIVCIPATVFNNSRMFVKSIVDVVSVVLDVFKIINTVNGVLTMLQAEKNHF